MKADQITVLMSVYNGVPYVRDAIRSILEQTCQDFEFIIINDGSTDKSLQVIREFDDPRIRIVDQENIGLAASLNKGMKLATGQLIARMDADDISLPHRLQAQAEYMQSHPDVGVCGGWVKTIGNNRESTWRYPEHDDEIKAALLFESPLPHPSVMMRKAMFVDNGLAYSSMFRTVQDYDLWERASHHMAFANVQDVLLRYRTHDSNTGKILSAETDANSRVVRTKQIKALDINPTQDEEELHDKLSRYDLEDSKDFVLSAERWLKKLLQSNHERRIYPEAAFRKMLARKWFDICLLQGKLGWWPWRAFYSSALAKDAGLACKEHLYFFIKFVVGLAAADRIVNLVNMLKKTS